MDARIIGTFRLLFDMIGAIFVAIEVVKSYRGSITSGVNGTWAEMGKPTKEYQEFERQKHYWMKTGLGFLLLGFVLQIFSIWMK